MTKTAKENIAHINMQENNLFRFRNIFPDEDTCLALLAELKWEDGFTCRHCGHHNSCRGKNVYAKRCTKCKREESATAHTVFHKCKIPIHKAFEIAYMACSFPAISSYEISRQSELRHMTCYKFQKKIRNCKEEGDEDGLFTKIISVVNRKVMSDN
jgi:hypothetical protein